MDQIQEWFAQERIDLERGHEFAAYVINGAESFQFNGNIAG